MARRTALLLLMAAVLACNPRKTMWELGFGSFMTDLTVVGVDTRGPYRDALLEGHGLSIRTFVPDDGVCRRVLELDATVDYVERGIGGRFVRDDESCDAVGIGSPLVDRARQPRAGSLRSSPIPRETARFQLIHEDEVLLLARGRFPLTATVGWARGDDTVAAFPNTPVCRTPLERGVASMEYRASGRVTLALVGDRGLCPFLGLLLPLGDQSGLGEEGAE